MCTAIDKDLGTSFSICSPVKCIMYYKGYYIEKVVTIRPCGNQTLRVEWTTSSILCLLL